VFTKKETYFRFKTTTTYKGIIMDLEIIEILYKFGKIFALTPLSSKKKKLNGRILHFDNCHGTKSRAVVHIDPESQNCQLKLSQFFYTICACVVLKILLSRYHYAVVCNKYSQSQPALKKFKRTLFVLKRTVDAFNDLFGWTISNSNLCGVTRTLVYLPPIYNQN
jgi:hypothetical protein